jgi:hypothetical protein
MPVKTQGLPLLVLGLCAVLFALRKEQADARQSTPIASQREPSTVCDIIINAKALNGTKVSVRAFIIGGIGHGIALVDQRCKGGLTMDAPAAVRDHEDYLELMRTIVKEGSHFDRESRTHVTGTFYGLIEYHPRDQEKWVLNIERITGITVERKAAGGTGH